MATTTTADALVAVRNATSVAAKALQAAETAQAVAQEARKAVKDIKSAAKIVALAAKQAQKAHSRAGASRSTSSQLDRVLASARPAFQSDEDVVYGNSKRDYGAVRDGAAARPFSNWHDNDRAPVSGSFYVDRAFWKEPAEDDSAAQRCGAARTWSSRQPDDDAGAPESFPVRRAYSQRAHEHRAPRSSNFKQRDPARETES